ncbi:SusD/RagB family nutrient-binding outer membrane lipoprotein [Siphonobacter aquaeclarae]|uniref:Starch-binding associating with outer membrane n=1 Tax=Siphonobacter aquaeclarae TaxID=563176 RepID=A0A1G9MHA0_9BACT|nr:SusD/RagB family nutrient-binding outer membrane lipoprotein [Siphonobacter aquaeclarae]SDL73599.1 Starch-binding associating with outer membrane [Siphonobacter aquaeclarae]
MKKILSLLIVAALAASCERDLQDLNTDKKHPSAGTVPSGTVFAAAETNLFEQMVNTSVNRNVFRLFAQQWTETTYTDESNYNIVNRKIPDAVWFQLYIRVLNNLKEAKALVTAEKPIAPDEVVAKANKIQVIELLTIYTYQVLVDTYGNVPYSEATNPDNVLPKYDDAKTIYQDLAKRLDAAIAGIKADGGSFGSADLIYQGDMTKWAKFANSLKLKIGLTLSDVDPATAKSMVEAAAAGVFSSDADNTRLRYSASMPNTNPVWLDLVQSQRHDFVPANTVVDLMNQLADPRRKAYFTLLNGKYVGGAYAAGGNYTNFSQVGDIFFTPSLEGVLMDYSEVCFGLAEGAARGFNVGGTAESFYNKGITASITYWGGTVDDASAYLATPDVAYATAKGTFRQVIGTQKYIALYNRGFEAWTEWRRFDFPTFNPPPGMTYADIPVRFTYPIGEQTLNNANWQAASNAIGSDKVTSKLFWDKN